MKADFLIARGVRYGRHQFLLTRANHPKELGFKRAVLVNKLRLHKPQDGKLWRSLRGRRALQVAKLKLHRHPKYVATRPNFRFHSARVKGAD
ncbi:MAG: hypothetical protein RSG77_17030 [Hafnia sp.]